VKSNPVFELSNLPNPVLADEKMAKQRFVGAQWMEALAKSMSPLRDEKSLSLRANAKARNVELGREKFCLRVPLLSFSPAGLLAKSSSLGPQNSEKFRTVTFLRFATSFAFRAL
jgi:hypothetical protein